ncbi:MAG: Crp/Fnr family transcriptional regulator [Ferruginibacter sp.]
MATDILLQYIKKHIELTDEESSLYVSLFKHRKIKKKQFLFQEGDVCKYASFVVKGCLRSFGIDKNGGEHVFQFAVENWWIGDIESFNRRTPSLMNVDALEDSEILMISRDDSDMLYEKIPKYEHFTRILMENAFIAHQQRIIQNSCFSAAERYQFFKDKYPFFAERLPQAQIASYLGVTPEFFSKMRSQLLKS